MAVASFCVYDFDKRAVEFHFVEHDVEQAQKKIREAGPQNSPTAWLPACDPP
jgi:hypothetical protein